MKLSRIERWILANQYKILEKIDPDEAKYYANIQETLNSGYELEYDWKIDYIYSDESCVSAERCREILEILSMFRDLGRSHEELADKSNIDVHWVRCLDLTRIHRAPFSDTASMCSRAGSFRNAGHRAARDAIVTYRRWSFTNA